MLLKDSVKNSSSSCCTSDGEKKPGDTTRDVVQPEVVQPPVEKPEPAETEPEPEPPAAGVTEKEMHNLLNDFKKKLDRGQRQNISDYEGTIRAAIKDATPEAQKTIQSSIEGTEQEHAYLNSKEYEDFIDKVAEKQDLEELSFKFCKSAVATKGACDTRLQNAIEGLARGYVQNISTDFDDEGKLERDVRQELEQIGGLDTENSAKDKEFTAFAGNLVKLRDAYKMKKKAQRLEILVETNWHKKNPELLKAVIEQLKTLTVRMKVAKHGDIDSLLENHLKKCAGSNGGYRKGSFWTGKFKIDSVKYLKFFRTATEEAWKNPVKNGPLGEKQNPWLLTTEEIQGMFEWEQDVIGLDIMIHMLQRLVHPENVGEKSNLHLLNDAEKKNLAEEKKIGRMQERRSKFYKIVKCYAGLHGDTIKSLVGETKDALTAADLQNDIHRLQLLKNEAKRQRQRIHHAAEIEYQKMVASHDARESSRAAKALVDVADKYLKSPEAHTGITKSTEREEEYAKQKENLANILKEQK